jgi:Flp pilus assembly protein TadD
LLHDLQDGRRVNFSEWVQLLDLALQGKDDGLIDDVAQALKKLEGEDTGAWWRYTEAAHHIVKVRHGNRSGLDAARTILEKVANLRPGWGRAALLQAHLNGVAGNAAGELDGYQRAFDLGERQLPTVQRLVQMLAERGRFVEADEVLRKAQQNLILRGDFARTAAEIALHVRNFERAVVLARLYVPEGVTDPARMLWLGQLYVDAGHPQEAEAHFRAVIDQAFDAERKVLRYDPLEGWLRLVALLVRDKRPQDAEAVIEKMRQQLPAEQLPLALGDCFEKLGKLAQAETQYRAGLDLRRNQPLLQPRLAQLYIRMDQAEKAVPLLMRLLGPEENRAWAQRQLALVLADRGGDENYKAALALLEENRKNGRGSIADERAGSFVQATRPENRAAALKALETSLAAQPLDPDEQFRLARLYEAAESDWPRVRDLMGELVKKDPTNPEYLAHHIGNLLKHGNQNEALALVERLAQLEPESERVRRFREDRK